MNKQEALIELASTRVDLKECKCKIEQQESIIGYLINKINENIYKDKDYELDRIEIFVGEIILPAVSIKTDITPCYWGYKHKEILKKKENNN